MLVALLLTALPADAKPLPFETLTPTTEVPEKGALEVRRSVDIAAPPELVMPYLTHLDTWKSWAAWNETTCAGTEWTYTGTQGEAGATMAWTGKKCGDGRMVVTTVVPEHGGATYDTFFGKSPDAMKGLIAVTATATGSTVEWRDVMSYGFPMSLFVSRKKMDAMLGDDFAKGLAELKVRAEADAAKAAEAARVAAEAAAKKAAEEAAAKKAAEEAAAAKAAEEAAAKKAAEEAAAKPKKKGTK